MIVVAWVVTFSLTFLSHLNWCFQIKAILSLNYFNYIKLRLKFSFSLIIKLLKFLFIGPATAKGEKVAHYI